MAGQLTIDTLKASSGVLATQNGMTGICKAWVNFNGAGVATIRNSFNVSSMTFVSAGVYTITFTNAMPNTSYAVSAITSRLNASVAGCFLYINESGTLPSVNSFNLTASTTGSATGAPVYNGVAVFSS